VYGRLKEFKANSAKKKMIKRICKECGKEFIPKYGDKRRSFCSEFCCHKYTVKAKYKDARKRARALGVYYEYVNPLKVFKRDGWCCQLCGKKLKPKHRGTYRDDAPELDHIIPWAQGGEHSYRNTQLACRKCNAEKGAQSIGQMLLFG
jgi:5-methylcytosine-specific restriction endonuclease McrA